jgi:hypothetical protein
MPWNASPSATVTSVAFSFEGGVVTQVVATYTLDSGMGTVSGSVQVTPTATQQQELSGIMDAVLAVVEKETGLSGGYR